MFRVLLLAVGLAAAGLLDPTFAQTGFTQTGFAPAPPYYATNPSGSTAPGTPSPVQQQIQDNYRLQLLQTQREMLLQNPSGLGREQIEVNRQLNTYAASPANIVHAAPPAAVSLVPPTVHYAAPDAHRALPPVHRPVTRRPAPIGPNSDTTPSQ